MRDEGLGIPTDQQQRIFTKFFRGDVGRELGISGTGLGLVLARQIVEAHGGEIGFESVEGEGSTFWLQLPAAAEARLTQPETIRRPVTGYSSAPFGAAPRSPSRWLQKPTPLT